MKFDRQRFVADMRTLASRGVRFRHQGRDPETGMDCINAPAWGYEQQGLRLPTELDREFESYHEQPDGTKFLEIMRRWFEELSPDKVEPGDLLILYARRNPQHLAVIVQIDPMIVVEAYRSMDRSIEKIIEQPVDPRRRIAAAFRIPNFA